MRRKRTMSLTATGLAVAAAVVLCTVPVYSGQTTGTSSDGTVTSTDGAQTVLQVMGSGYLVVLLLPAVLAAVPLLLRGRAASIAALVAAVLVSAFVVLGLMSIGLFYLPAAAFAVIAAALPNAPRAAS